MAENVVEDEVLVAGLRRGSPEAHEQLWLKYSIPLRGFLRSLGAIPEDADDIAVDTIARAVEKIHQFDAQKSKSAAPFRTWLFSIARNLWRDHLRKTAKQVPLDSQMENIAEVEVIDNVSPEINDALNQALAGLPEKQRQTLVLHFFYGMALADIAKQMSVPESTVRQWKKRGIDTLGTVLEDLPVFAEFVVRE